jgi:hypothetical protein
VFHILIPQGLRWQAFSTWPHSILSTLSSKVGMHRVIYRACQWEKTSNKLIKWLLRSKLLSKQFVRVMLIFNSHKSSGKLAKSYKITFNFGTSFSRVKCLTYKDKCTQVHRIVTDAWSDFVCCFLTLGQLRKWSWVCIRVFSSRIRLENCSETHILVPNRTWWALSSGIIRLPIAQNHTTKNLKIRQIYHI